MSLASVKRFFATHAPDVSVVELPSSTATVALAAEAHGAPTTPGDAPGRDRPGWAVTSSR